MKKIIHIALLVFFAAACTAEYYTEPETKKGEELKFISFTIRSGQTGEQSGVSRSTPDPVVDSRGVPSDGNYNENIIKFSDTEKDVHLFFYDLNKTSCIFYPESERLKLFGTDALGEKTIQIDLEAEAEGQYEAFDPATIIGKNTIVYVVANSGLPRETFLNGTTVKPLDEVIGIVIEADFNQVNGDGSIKKQEKFVMDDMQQVYIGAWTHISTLNLSRAASKIQIGVYNASVNGYTAASAQVKLVNFVNKSALGCYDGQPESFTPATGDFLTRDYIPVPLPASGTDTPATVAYAEPFYSYSRDWSTDPDNGAYLLLKVMWYNSEVETPGDAKPYYYKLPISDISADSEAGRDFRNRLRRNYIYRYYVTLTALGGLDPAAPLTLEDTNLDIMNWTKTDIPVSIQKFDWLFVEEQDVVIYPVAGQTIQEYLIPYRSNTKLTNIVDESGNMLIAQYEDYTNGTFRLLNYARPSYASDPNNHTLPTDAQLTQFPYINFNYVVGTRRYIRIRSRTPVNYVPKHIKFKVENEAHLFASVTITHYPPLYVTATNISGRLQYCITTLAITGNERLWTYNYKNAGFATNSLPSGISGTPWVIDRHYSVGSVFNGRNLIADNFDNAWVVSPKFYVESNPNIDTRTRSSATDHCQTRDGISGWRLPTMAELYLIYKLQNDPTENRALQGAISGAAGAARIWAAGYYALNSTSRHSNGTQFQVAGSVLNDKTGDGDTARGALGIYVHTATCVRDAYQ